MPLDSGCRSVQPSASVKWECAGLQGEGRESAVGLREGGLETSSRSCLCWSGSFIRAVLGSGSPAGATCPHGRRRSPAPVDVVGCQLLSSPSESLCSHRSVR